MTIKCERTYYRGYVRTKDKIPTSSFKNDTDLFALSETIGFDEFAGVLAKGTVLVDVDDGVQADRLFDIIKAQKIQCTVIQTTRGKHFIFVDYDGKVTKCQTHVKLAVGITADIKVGVKNSIEVLKFRGVERPVLMDTDTPCELPYWLRPVETKMDLFDMSEGGRNDTLFRYILILQKAGLDHEQIRHTAHLINDWIFKIPLDISEIETITREEAFIKNVGTDFFTEDGKFLFYDFADVMIEHNFIKRINGMLHVYRDGVYVPADDNLLGNICLGMERTLKNANRKEVIAYIQDMICDNSIASDPRYIAFDNGIYDLYTDSLIGFSPDIVITNRIPHNYNSSAKSKVVDEMFDKLTVGNKEIQMLMEEMIGYCFYRKNAYRGAFILVGDGKNGKSTFLDCIKNVLGQSNVSAIDLKSLGERFSTVHVFGKLANIGDDISSKYIEDSAVFKKLVTGEPLTAEYKGKDGFIFESYATQIFSANSIPRMDDESGATTDRIIIIPFNAIFDKSSKDFNPHMKQDLSEEICQEYLIQLGLKGLKRLLENDSFTVPSVVNDMMASYKRSNEPILDFLDDYDIDQIRNHTINGLYLDYTRYCAESGLKAVSNISFSKTIKKKYGVSVVTKRIDGKSQKVFI